MNSLTKKEISVLKHLVQEKIESADEQTPALTISQYNIILARLATPTENIDLIYTCVECLEEVIKSTADKIMMDELEDINHYIGMIKEQLKNEVL